MFKVDDFVVVKGNTLDIRPILGKVKSVGVGSYSVQTHSGLSDIPEARLIAATPNLMRIFGLMFDDLREFIQAI